MAQEDTGEPSFSDAVARIHISGHDPVECTDLCQFMVVMHRIFSHQWAADHVEIEASQEGFGRWRAHFDFSSLLRERNPEFAAAPTTIPDVKTADSDDAYGWEDVTGVMRRG